MINSRKKIILAAALIIVAGLLSILAKPLLAQNASLSMHQQAEQLLDEKSYQLALEKYKLFAAEPGITVDQKRESIFRIADCSWRIGNTTLNAEASLALKQQVIAPDHDRWWAEANQSLAEYFIKYEQYSHRETIKKLLMSAREFWSGYADTGLARPRFIQVTFTLAEYVLQNWGNYFETPDQTSFRAEKEDDMIGPPEHFGPIGIKNLMQDVLKVAEKPEDKARATYLLASVGMSTGDETRQKESIGYFETLIKDYNTSEWVDDAFNQLASMYERRNDFIKALETYQALLTQFKPGESSFLDNARSRVKDITTPVIQPGVSYNFLPESQIRFSLRWRNLKEAEFTFFRIDLTEELRFDPNKDSTNNDRGVDSYARLLKILVDSRRYEQLPIALTFKRKMKDEGKYLWSTEEKSLSEWQLPDNTDDRNEKPDSPRGTLPVGAYLLMVKNGISAGYELVMVTDLGLLVKSSSNNNIFFAFDTASGEPKTGTRLKYHYRYYDRGNYVWVEGDGTTDNDGIVKVDLPVTDQKNNAQHQIFAVVSDGTKQAFTNGNYYSYSTGPGEYWLYAFTDRPVYRPNEVVSFKGTLRRYDGSAFATPAGMQVKAQLYDARNSKILEKVYSLNAFGSFNDTLTLDEKAVLGEYRLELYAGDNQNHLAQATLFRLEEYKLPEFKVTIKPQPKGEGQFANAYRLGDSVALNLDAQYYFGGPVPKAEVEFFIYERPDYPVYSPGREYEWYYAPKQDRNYYGNGVLVKKGKVVTDAEGKAKLEFETNKTGAQDLAYRVEARVVDASRREITAVTEIKVTKKAFFIYPEARRNLYRPGDKALVEIKTLTANNEPVEVEGKVTVTRHWWREPALTSVQTDKSTVLSKKVQPYDDQVLFSKFFKTDTKGRAVFEFQPDQNGYYSVTVTGFDTDGSVIESAANVFVCDKQANDIGYRYSGLQIITEKDTYTVGETLRFMLVSDKPKARVLLAMETDNIDYIELVRMEGSVKLIELPVTSSFTPNIFISALSASDQQIRKEDVELIVPPDDHFLNVVISSNKPVYAPGENGEFEVKVTNKAGNPVAAELALSLVDASVFYIQSDLAGDIRQFFFGAKRQHSVNLWASMNERIYQKFTLDEKGSLVNSINPTDYFDSRGDSVGNEKDSGFQRRIKERAAVGAKNSIDKITAEVSPAVMAVREGKGFDSDFKKQDVNKPGKSNTSISAAVAEPLMDALVRQDFRSTVYWGPMLTTDAHGQAKVQVHFPDPLTTWQATARAISTGTDIGSAAYDVTTKKDIIVRLQAPRFFTERDHVIISANVHNYTQDTQHIKVSMKADGLKLDGGAETWVDVDPLGEKRVDWTAIADKPGLAQLTVMAQTTTVSDAMQKKYPVIPHGIEKFLARALVLKTNETLTADGKFTFDVPKDRVKESTVLRLTLSPSMAAAMLDALPYLANFPYGCVEQTMSRFLPGVIVAKTMHDLGIDQKDVDDYLENVLQPRLDPQGQSQRRGDQTLPRLKEITTAGLNRLYDFQHSDGGWGWWKGGDSDRFMSAYVVWGLALARDSGVDVRGDVVSRGFDFLDKSLVDAGNEPDMLAWMLHAMAYVHRSSSFQDKQITRLWDMREKLNSYSRALFALGQKIRNQNDQALILSRNIINGIEKDNENTTAHWGEAGINYHWSEGGVEATAFCLKALINIDPANEFIAPAVKWLALNRQGASWKNTRDSAITILSLTDYLKSSGELDPDFEYEVILNGVTVQHGPVNTGNMFTFARYIDLPAESIKDGINTVKVTVKGKGSLYVSGHLKYFTLEENILPEGNELFVERKYFRQSQKETLLKGYVEDWKPVEDGHTLHSGDRVKVELTLEAKNNYEYLILEDPKPAGLEAVELKSGDATFEALDKGGKLTGAKSYLYQEFRDQKAIFFLDKLKQGRHRITYELRAEVPGDFHALPDQAHAMYIPEIRANTAEGRVKVSD